jgi:hypothetical protein
MGEIKRGIQTSTLDLGPSHPMGPIAYNIYYIIYIYIHIIGKYTGKKGGNGVKGNGFLSLSLSLSLSGRSGTGSLPAGCKRASLSGLDVRNEWGIPLYIIYIYIYIYF